MYTWPVINSNVNVEPIVGHSELNSVDTGNDDGEYDEDDAAPVSVPASDEDNEDDESEDNKPGSEANDSDEGEDKMDDGISESMKRKKNEEEEEEEDKSKIIKIYFL